MYNFVLKNIKEYDIEFPRIYVYIYMIYFIEKAFRKKIFVRRDLTFELLFDKDKKRIRNNQWRTVKDKKRERRYNSVEKRKN